MSNMYPVNDAWFGVTVGGAPLLGRLSGVRMVTKAADGRAVLHTVNTAEPVVTIDQAYEEMVNVILCSGQDFAQRQAVALFRGAIQRGLDAAGLGADDE